MNPRIAELHRVIRAPKTAAQIEKALHQLERMTADPKFHKPAQCHPFKPFRNPFLVNES